MTRLPKVNHPIRRLPAAAAGVVVAVLAVVAALLGAPSAVAASNDSVLMVHGFDFSGGGMDCEAIWGNQRRALDALGATGRHQTIGWYSGNRNCQRNATSTEYTRDFAGDVTAEQGNSRNVLDKETSFRHSAYRVAWAIAKEARDNGGANIRIIAHSSGGVLMRLIMQQASLGNPNFPSLDEMRVTDVYGYGVPHNGAIVARLDGSLQGRQLRPESDVFDQLRGDPRVGSARWLNFTSTYFNNATGVGDGVVGESSACWDRSLVCYRYENPAYRHTTALPGDAPTYQGDAEIGVPRERAYRTHFPAPGAALNWGGLINGIGAAGFVANRIATS